MIVNETKKILKNHNIFAKKGFGQNFIIDENVLRTIIDYSKINTTCGVIEIGPGIGSLTEFLALNSKLVVCYEIDKDMILILNSTLQQYKNVIVNNIDFLKVDIDKDIEKYFSSIEDIIVIANLPYYITTPILFKLLQSNIKQFIIMVQKEVGMRLTGKPNTKDYNALSVIMSYKTNSKIISNVSRKSFYPEPNVDSVLLHIKMVKNDYRVNFEGNFIEFVQVIFRQRRKTLINNIISFYNYKKEELINTLKDIGYDPNIRAEALEINELIQIYKRLFE